MGRSGACDLTPKTLTLHHKPAPPNPAGGEAMRAVTGTIHSSQPCPTAKVPRVFERFLEGVSSGILSSDAATYLRTAIEAADELNFFRRDLRRRQLREGGGDSERRHRHAPVDEEDRWEPKVEEEDGRWELKVEDVEEDGMSVPAAGETKSSKSKGLMEDEDPIVEKRDIAAPHGDTQNLASEKQRKKTEKGVKEEDETGDVIEEQSRKALGAALQGMVSEEGIGSEKKARKRKKHIKQEEEVRGAKEVEPKMVHAGVAENGLASEEKQIKKRKHTEEEEVKKEVILDGDLGSDKKRKKKRGRAGDIGNDTELVEHKQKKQRK